MTFNIDTIAALYPTYPTLHIFPSFELYTYLHTDRMASDGQGPPEAENHRVGEHWSGNNPIPTVKKFIEHLDSEKRERDRRIDEENRAKKQFEKQHKHDHKTGERTNGQNGEIASHQAREVSKAKMRTVTDPTTGKEIGVEDQDESSMEAVTNPQV